MNEILVRIRFLLPTLSRAEKQVALAILDNPDRLSDFTLAALARETGSSDASIIRFCRHLGFNGYTELKKALTEEAEHGEELISEEISASDNMQTILNKVYHSNMQALSETILLASENYQLAMEKLLDARSIHFFGVGDAAAVCSLAMFKFGRLGIPVSAHTDAAIQLMQAGQLGPGDVAFAISYEGRSRNIVDCMRIANESGAATIAITKMSRAPMMKYVDIGLYIATSDLSVGRDIVTRRVADQMIIDALYLGVLVHSDTKVKSMIKKMRLAIDCNKLKKVKR